MYDILSAGLPIPTFQELIAWDNRNVFASAQLVAENVLQIGDRSTFDPELAVSTLDASRMMAVRYFTPCSRTIRNYCNPAIGYKTLDGWRFVLASCRVGKRLRFMIEWITAFQAAIYHYPKRGEFIDLATAAKLTSVCTSTIEQWISNGELVHYQRSSGSGAGEVIRGEVFQLSKKLNPSI